MEFFVIGDEEVVLGFRFAGAEGVSVYNRAGALEAFRRATTGGDVKILVLTEQVSAMIEAEVLAWQYGGAYPLVVEVPGIEGHLENRRGLVDAIREAVGVRVEPGGGDRHRRAGQEEGTAVEVLNTGEELGRQILEDARKKASRVLEAADKECAAIGEAGRRAAEAEIARLRADGDRQIAAMRAEMASALPLDFLRTRLAFIQDTVVAGLRSFFDGLSPEDLAEILAGRIRRAADALAGRTVTVRHGGLDAGLARATVERAAPGVSVGTLQPLPGGRGLEVESEDGRVRFRCTTAELEAELLEERREELAVAALGSGIPEAGA